MKIKTLNRNYTLDLLKLFSAFMIVLIHVPFYGEFGTAIKAVARFAVPVFFMTSGYFCYKNDTKKITKKILNIAKIFVFTSAFYNATDFILELIKGGIEGVAEHFSVYADASRWIDLAFFNRPFSSVRLWFLLALIYVYGIQIILQKFHIKSKTILFFSIAGLIINVIMTEGCAFFGVFFEDHLTRNFLLTGYPFFGIGLFLRENKEKAVLIKPYVCVFLIAVGIVITLLSNSYVKSLCLYAGSIIIAFASFVLAMKAEGVRYPDCLVKLSSTSLGIYIFHRPITTFINQILEAISIKEGSVAAGIILPILVCFVTAIFSLLLISLKNYLIKKRIINRCVN